MTRLVDALVDALLGCSHRRTTFPLSPGRKQSFSAPETRRSTYVVCLDCGKEFAYSWSEMTMGGPLKQPERRAEAVEAEA